MPPSQPLQSYYTQSFSRLDPQISFNWDTTSPYTAIAQTNFAVEWTGYLTVPSACNCYLAMIHDDGAVVTVNGTTASNHWADSAPDANPVFDGPNVSLYPGVPYKITVDYYQHGSGARAQLWIKGDTVTQQIVPTSFLSPADPVLPQGWSLSAAMGASPAYSVARRGSNGVTMISPDGAVDEFRTAGPGGWTPPPGVDGFLSSPDGVNLVLQDDDGRTYTYGSDGNLTSVTSAVDDRHPAAAQYTYGVVPNSGSPVQRLASIADPASNTVVASRRAITFTYNASNGAPTCPTPPAGYQNPPPASVLCTISYWDGTSTNLYYQAGQLARVVNPGNAITSFAYDSTGRLMQIQDPLSSDATTSFGGTTAVRTDTAVTTNITYENSTDRNARVTQVLLPAPAAGATRPGHNYSYLGLVGGFQTTQVKDPFLSPQPAQGYLRQVSVDPWDRAYLDTDGVGRQSRTDWGVPNVVYDTIDNTGLERTFLYDSEARLTDTYGPALQGCFTPQRTPTSGCSTMAHTQTVYDQNMSGLAAAYWANNNVGGSPHLHQTGVGDASNQLNLSWSGAPIGLLDDAGHQLVGNGIWSAQYTGEIQFPVAGNYDIAAWATDTVQVFIDDTLITAGYGPGFMRSSQAAPFTAQAGSWHRIRVLFESKTAGTNAQLQLQWTGPAGSGLGPGLVPGAYLRPRYGLATHTVSTDGGANPAQATDTAYARPENGLASSTTVDPGGRNLVTATDYETPGTGFLRPIAKSLPAANGNDPTRVDPTQHTTYSYYGSPETVASPPCGLATGVNQAGMLKSTKAPTPASGPALTRTSVYDSSGRVVASQVNTESSWECRTYDSRGRVTNDVIPASPSTSGAEPGRTVVYGYVTTDSSFSPARSNPLISTVSDGSGSSPITTKLDLLGRVISYTDAWGKTTSYTYDLESRLTDTSGPAGTQHTDYDGANRPTGQKLDGAQVATATYAGAGNQLSGVTYPSGTGNGGNGSYGTFGYDATYLRPSQTTWSQPGGTTISNMIQSHSSSGTTNADNIDGNSYAYTYDGAGRLTQATIPGGHTLTYDFVGNQLCNSGQACPDRMGNDTNRLKLTDTVGSTNTVTTYAYDAADRLTSTSDARYPSIAYDTHGNTTTLGSQAMTYDEVDRHMSTTAPGTTVRYTRDANDRIIARDATTITTGASTSASNGSGATTVVLPTPSGTAAGDVLVAEVTAAGGSGVTLTPPAGWTAAATPLSNGTAVRTGLWWHAVTATAEPASYTFSLSASKEAAGGMVAYRGLNTTTPVQVVASGTSGAVGSLTTSHVAPSVTPTATGDRLVAAYGIQGANGAAIPTGTTSRANVASTGSVVASRVTAVLADQDQLAAASTGTRTATSTAAGSSANFLVALNPARSTTRYAFTGPGDSQSATLDTTNTVIERTIGLIGGAMVTKRSGGDVWSYPNMHGDVVATANSSGVKTAGTFLYDPYGQAVGSAPDNSIGNLDYGWLGNKERGFEHQGSVATVEMGARQYLPGTGRFLSVDPVAGGSANDYDYAAADPVNGRDLDGRRYVGTNVGRHQAWYCLFHAKRCFTSMNSLRHRAEQATAKLGDQYGWDEGQRNAFRHGYWMAMIAKRYGVGFAVGLGYAHEADTPGHARDSASDINNNKVGAHYGASHHESDARLAIDVAGLINDNDWDFDYGGGN